MQIHEIGKIIAYNNDDLISNYLQELGEIPNEYKYLKNDNALKKFISKQLSLKSTFVENKIQETEAPKALNEEVILYRNIKELDDESFKNNIANIVIRIPQTSFFHKDAQHFITHTSNNDSSKMVKALFLKKWREALNHHLMSVELELAEQERNNIEQEFKERFKIANIVVKTVKPNSPGKLWDLSSSHIISTELRHLTHYAQFLGKNKAIQQIADELGRAGANTPKKIKNFEDEVFYTLKKDMVSNEPEDISGLCLNNNLIRTISSEFTYLGEPDLEQEFYKKFVEKQLLNYDFNGHGLVYKEEHAIHSKYGDIIEPKGPFIIAIDTSGSMSGYPEEATKAICLALAQIAFKENRRMFVIMFSTNIITLELTDSSNLNSLLTFLSKSFKGGTDFEPCIAQIVNLMKTENYKNADAVLISDFIAQRLKHETVDAINEIKKNKNRFNAIRMSRYGKTVLMQNIFDAEWTFDTGLRSRILRKIK